jgi:uncharacterized lipoprotein YehR (DUF1307 family)
MKSLKKLVSVLLLLTLVLSLAACGGKKASARHNTHTVITNLNFIFRYQSTRR